MESRWSGYGRPMEPIPETLAAINELEPYVDDGSLLEQLRQRSDQAREIAPHLVGVSVAVRDQGVTFTLVATDEDTAALDGVQYLASGPCVDALEVEHGLAVTEQDLLSEPRWQALGQAGAAAGVRSTLTFPIVEAGEVVGTVNLYGGSEDAFDGKHSELASTFRAWAPGAVANADLSFSTRSVAEQAPAHLRDEMLVDTATGIVSATHHLEVEVARERLWDAARRAGVPLARLCHAIVELTQG